MADEGGIASRILGRHLVIEDETEETFEKESKNDEVVESQSIRLPFRKQGEDGSEQESDKKLETITEDKQDLLIIEDLSGNDVQKAPAVTDEAIIQKNKDEAPSTTVMPVFVSDEEASKEQANNIESDQKDIPLKFDFQETDVIPQIDKGLNKKFQGLDDFELYELKQQQNDQESDAEVCTPKIEDSGLTELEKKINEGIKKSTHINNGGVQQMSKNEEIESNFDTASEEQGNLIVLNFGSTSQAAENPQEEKHEDQESEELNFDNIFVDYHLDSDNFATQSEEKTIDLPELENEDVKMEENIDNVNFVTEETPISQQSDLEETAQEQNIFDLTQTLNEEIKLDFDNDDYIEDAQQETQYFETVQEQPRTLFDEESNNVQKQFANEASIEESVMNAETILDQEIKLDSDINEYIEEDSQKETQYLEAKPEQTIMLSDEDSKNNQELLINEISAEEPVINIDTGLNEELSLQKNSPHNSLDNIDNMGQQPPQTYGEEEISIDDIVVEDLNNEGDLKQTPVQEEIEYEQLTEQGDSVGKETTELVEILSKERMSIYLSDEQFDAEKFERFMNGLLRGEEKQSFYYKLRELETQYLFENFIQLFDIGNFMRKRITIDDKVVSNTFDLNDEVLLDVYVAQNNTKNLEFERGEYSVVVCDSPELDVANLRERILNSKLNSDNVLIAVLAGTTVDEQAVAAASKYGVKVIKMDSNLSTVNKNLEDLMKRIAESK